MGDALAGRVALVTGASRGIGAAIAIRLAAEGAAVAVVARSLEPGSGGHLAGSLRETVDAITAAGGRAVPIVADLADPGCDRSAIVSQAAAELGPVDVLVNNAAACFYLSIDETSERRLRVAYEVNVITPYLLTKAVTSTAIIERHWGAEKIDYRQAERKTTNVRELQGLAAGFRGSRRKEVRRGNQAWRPGPRRYRYRVYSARPARTRR